MKSSKFAVVGFWIFTVLFALEMGFTAYSQLKVPVVAAAFVRYGFPSYFREELAWAKFAGLVVLLVPMVPSRLKEWAYCGFAIVLVSALITHFAMGEGFNAWMWAAGTSVLWALSYGFWLRVSAMRAQLKAA
jgi:hypothetical protein